ncbi:hypothetical protein AB835_06980 [Candidatus Endobugula sertula]|uniref:Uncharacterized protein n=1 Tax=Candidatus Endobugula sertula TaxID=62101 RepID=A0A1D2QQD2_9GAMM|nr:hypothetical protein AB835_06980 [Candidatus Endobugula sertula]
MVGSICKRFSLYFGCFFTISPIAIIEWAVQRFLKIKTTRKCVVIICFLVCHIFLTFAHHVLMTVCKGLQKSCIITEIYLSSFKNNTKENVDAFTLEKRKFSMQNGITLIK